jgi:hypothetical protein
MSLIRGRDLDSRVAAVVKIGMVAGGRLMPTVPGVKVGGGGRGGDSSTMTIS